MAAILLTGHGVVRVFEDLEALSSEAARAILLEAQATDGAFHLVLSGGSTPRRTYELLAQGTRDDARLWERTHLYWGDERFVSHDDPHSNYRTAAPSLLERVPVPPENVHPIPTDGPDPEACARSYEDVFPARPDLMLLGMGADGHTASLFPGSAALEEEGRRFVAVEAPAEPRLRITATPAVIHSAKHILVLVAGSDKAAALDRIFAEEGSPSEMPARLLRDTTWFVDSTAAQDLLSRGAEAGNGLQIEEVT